MLNEINIQDLTEDTDMMLKNYHKCLDSSVCPDSSSFCHLGECENFPGTANLKDNMARGFNEHSIDEVRFKIWLHTNRCNLKALMILFQKPEGKFIVC